MIDSTEEFIRLRSSADPREYRRAVLDPASKQVWIDILMRYPKERLGVAQNKTVPLSVLEMLIDDPDSRVRFMVAMKRSLTPNLLERLARDADESIRLRVAQHKSTSRVTLESLRYDPWKEIRVVVEERLRN